MPYWTNVVSIVNTAPGKVVKVKSHVCIDTQVSCWSLFLLCLPWLPQYLWNHCRAWLHCHVSHWCWHWCPAVEGGKEDSNPPILEFLLFSMLRLRTSATCSSEWTEHVHTQYIALTLRRTVMSLSLTYRDTVLLKVKLSQFLQFQLKSLKKSSPMSSHS